MSYICRNKTFMQRDFIKVIKGTAEEILPKDSKVILFGSRARNDAREDSDWDLLSFA